MVRNKECGVKTKTMVAIKVVVVTVAVFDEEDRYS
jgi:hypothetical protein